ncbi:sporulation integral membrane protein YtvI [Gorillibacterium timonense]|uniref:sporulation integral membrane protein YtvI n=1 Tax=Gorillibacterium timonense TaxID=1689269 RepID=UPI00071E3851|nr:sporulation integral membrane protein YtvI [Gorillibacterium timonense]
MSIRNLVSLLILSLLLYGLFHYGAPFLFALVIAILLDPVVRLVMKANRVSRRLASILVCTLFTLLLFLLSYGLGNKLVKETTEFVKTLDADQIISQVTETTQNLFNSISPGLADTLKEGLSSALSSLSGALSGLSGYLLTLAATIPNFFLGFVVFLLGLYLISMNLPLLRESFLSIFEANTSRKMDSVLVTLKKAINGFIVAQLILSLITFLIMLTGLLILDSGYALALAFLVTAVDILPVFGTGSVLIPWGIYEIATGNSFLGIGLLVLYVVTLVVRRVVEPKVLGNAIGIGALPALVSLFIGFKLIGVAGLFLGPLVVIIYKAMRSVGLLEIKIKLG